MQFSIMTVFALAAVAVAAAPAGMSVLDKIYPLYRFSVYESGF